MQQVEIFQEYLNWAKKNEDIYQTSRITQYLLHALCSCTHCDKTQEMLLRLIPDLFQLCYEGGRNPCGGESDDVHPMELLYSNKYGYTYEVVAEMVVETKRFGVVFRTMPNIHEMDVHILGRTTPNTHPWLVKL